MEKGHYSVLRVSHLSQIGNFSIEQQKESIQAYATLHSIEITEHLAECGSGTLRWTPSFGQPGSGIKVDSMRFCQAALRKREYSSMGVRSPANVE